MNLQDASTIKLGSEDVQSIRLGSYVLWERTPPNPNDRSLVLWLPKHAKELRDYSDARTPITANRAGVFNGGTLEIRGLYDFIDLPSNLAGLRSTLCAWFRARDTPLGDYHIVFGGVEHEMSIHDSGYLRLGYMDNGRRFVYNGGTGLTDGNWHHVAFARNAVDSESTASIHGYIDGQEVIYSGPLNRTAVTTDFADRRIGRFGASTQYALVGDLQDVRVHNVYLSQEEIQAIMEATRPD